MKKSAKKGKVNKGLLRTVGTALVGVAAGAAAMFLSEKEHRQAVGKVVNKTVKKGKTEAVKAEKKILAEKKKLVKK
jgi:hypothetical protein